MKNYNVNYVILLPAENIGYTSMTDDEFTTYLYETIGLTKEEIDIVENAVYSEA